MEHIRQEVCMSILMVVTSNDRLGDTGKPTGLWLEEFATPYYIFRDEGIKVVLASPKGGRPPIDPRSQEPQVQTYDMHTFGNRHSCIFQ